MKPIQLKRTVIDVPFVDNDGNQLLLLHFNQEQENMENLEKVLSDLGTQVEKMKDQEETSMSEYGQVIKSAFDSILGDGAYDQVYEISPNISFIANYLYQLAIGIKEEIEQEEVDIVKKKYLK
ncbi:hypothetical protein ACODG4_04300 [Vagococcus fluvialis]|uniref:hypothetical protein n=1 Tax=Vagococcus fluvialis TaxID=2738 RepID=UPI003B5B49DB